jgi:hypothetical protein
VTFSPCSLRALGHEGLEHEEKTDFSLCSPRALGLKVLEQEEESLMLRVLSNLRHV